MAATRIQIGRRMILKLLALAPMMPAEFLCPVSAGGSKSQLDVMAMLELPETLWIDLWVRCLNDDGSVRSLVMTNRRQIELKRRLVSDNCLHISADEDMDFEVEFPRTGQLDCLKLWDREVGGDCLISVPLPGYEIVTDDTVKISISDPTIS